ncbi:MAG: SpoIIE family protein phosphatase [Crocinitomix sp.]|nr:SpoIIE family protein phosphatase [Crocinitomix sp.]
MNMKSLILTLAHLLSVAYVSIGQDFSSEDVKTLDSLRSLVDNPSTADTIQWRAQLSAIEILQGYDIDQALNELNPLITELADLRKAKTELTESDPLFRVSLRAVTLAREVHSQHQNDFEGLQILEQFLLEIEDRGIRAPATLTNRIARSHKSLRNYNEAIAFFKMSYSKFIEEKDTIGSSAILINIGMVYSTMGQKDKALEYLYRSLEIKEQLNHIRGIVNCHNFIGIQYSALGEDSLALTHYLEAYHINDQLIKNSPSSQNESRSQFYIYQHLGDGYLALDSLKKASQFYNLALDESNRFNFPDIKVGALISKIKFLAQTDQSKELKTYFESANELLENERISLGSRNNMHYALYVGYKSLADPVNAYDHYKTHIRLRDSINGFADRREFLYREMSKKNETELLVQEADNNRIIDLKKEEGRKEKLLGYFIIGSACLLLLFLVFTFNRLRVVRKQKIEIENQKIEISKVHSQLENHHQDIQDSIRYAKHIQNAVLPPLDEISANLGESFVYYQPKDIVAGDFFWMEVANFDPDWVYYSVADCTGHGVPGALVSLVCSNALTKALKEENIRDTGLLLDRTRELVISQLGKRGETVKDGMDISICALNKKTKELQWSGANNPIWIIRGSSEGFDVQPEIEATDKIRTSFNEEQNFIEIKGDRQPIGVFHQSTPFKTYILKLNAGDQIYIFSDGFADQFGGEKGKKFKANNLKKLLLSITSKSMEKQKEVLKEVFENWHQDYDQLDDVCVLGVKI